MKDDRLTIEISLFCGCDRLHSARPLVLASSNSSSVAHVGCRGISAARDLAIGELTSRGRIYSPQHPCGGIPTSADRSSNHWRFLPSSQY